MGRTLGPSRKLKGMSEKFKIDPANASFGLMCTAGVGLRTWDKIGTLERETAICRKLCSHFKKVSIITFGGRRDKRYRSRMGDVSLIPTRWTRSAWLDARSLWYWKRDDLRSLDVVKTNQIRGSQVAVWLKKQLGCKLITRCGFLWALNVQREFPGSWRASRAREIEKRAFEEADLSVVTTMSNRDRVLAEYNVSEERIRVIPNFVDTDLFRPKSQVGTSVSGPTLAYVGRLAREKNLESLIKALAIVRDRMGDAPKLVVAGTGTLQSRLQSMARDRQLPVEFVGNVPNQLLPKLLWSTDIFLLPSLYEGHPKALLEAMSCGLPCIGANVEGIRAEIHHSRNGYLCEPSPEGIAEAIKTVLEDEGMMRTFSENARSHVEANYSMDRILRMEVEAISSVIRS